LARPVGRCGLCFWDIEPGEVYLPLPDYHGRGVEPGHMTCVVHFARKDPEKERPEARWLIERAVQAVKNRNEAKTARGLVKMT
jgi:hypothetical protein